MTNEELHEIRRSAVEILPAIREHLEAAQIQARVCSTISLAKLKPSQVQELVRTSGQSAKATVELLTGVELILIGIGKLLSPQGDSFASQKPAA